MRAYVLVKIEPGADVESLLNSIKQIEGVKSAAAVFGPYDIVVEAEAPDRSALNALIQKILDIKGVAETTTLVVARESS